MGNSFVGDVVVGWIGILRNVCGAVCGIIAAFFAGALGALAGMGGAETAPGAAVAGLAVGSFLFFMVLFLTLFYIIGLFIAFQMFKGTRKAITLNLVWNVLILVLEIFSSVSGVGFWSLIITVGIIIYCVLRLGGKVGPALIEG
ncbi:MAG: hypothetical protein ACK4P3_04920 [Fimbriimonadaceae bacterium]